MREYKATISENGRVVIPSIIRKELNLRIGDEVILRISEENDIIIHSPKQSLAKLQSIFKSKNKSNLVEEVINMRRKEEI